MVGALGQSWTTYPHTRLWLTRTRLAVGSEQQGLRAKTRLRKLEVDFSCRLPHCQTYFVVEEGGLRGVRLSG